MKKIMLLIVLALSMSLFAACVITPDPVDEEIPKENDTQSERLTDSGVYQGQADSNFIEIAISGVPEENAAKVFMLSADLKESFEELGLEGGETIRFEYFVDDNEQSVIEEIEILNP
ncbi:MAG: hypothetical protein QM215_04920 [Bacillota bacterium]|nr:hypothetical protein [Eubacteriales bacterium]MDI9492253.1 hypothetical protein [Bacillota bacterium]NLV70289.1 hypothetical protein [Clostridiales bacterium]